MLRNLLLIAIITFSVACSSDDPEIESEEEVITDVTLTFTEVDESGAALSASFDVLASDPEGLELGSSPTIGSITLDAGKRYLLEIERYTSIEDE
ncbi:MAG: hypothetical protein ACK4SB_09825, partial [Belliella pelovolcani]